VLSPTCSTAHVPGFVARLKDFRVAGIDDVVCLSVNDPFVMEAWQRSEKAEGIRFVADPFEEFTEAMGMAVPTRRPWDPASCSHVQAVRIARAPRSC
jgi:peroxiredoxin